MAEIHNFGIFCQIISKSAQTWNQKLPFGLWQLHVPANIVGTWRRLSSPALVGLRSRISFGQPNARPNPWPCQLWIAITQQLEDIYCSPFWSVHTEQVLAWCHGKSGCYSWESESEILHFPLAEVQSSNFGCLLQHHVHQMWKRKINCCPDFRTKLIMKGLRDTCSFRCSRPSHRLCYVELH